VRIDRRRLLPLFSRLLRTWGPQHWWPGETPFEVMVGAVLTQNTAWTNVEKAIANLVAHDWLDAGRIAGLRRQDLARCLKPSGYYNVKAERLQAFCRWYRQAGGYPALARLPTAELREALLAVTGIGPETADDILLYAFARPVFVVDAYTRRLFSRYELCRGDEPYEQLRTAVEAAGGADTGFFNELHALIVRHAKEVCRVRPRCSNCVLAGRCPAADAAVG
jgi:endonuclease-3 related protein